MRPFRLKCLALIILFMLPALQVAAQSPESPAPYHEPDSLVAALYSAVTFDPGPGPDWGLVRSMFNERAVIVLRVSRDSTAIMSVDGFVQDFVEFIRRFRADSTGFMERVVLMKPMIMGNIAHVLVLYEASIPGRNRPPQQGVDSFHLVRSEGRWWITSIVNEVPTKDRPIPPALRD